MPSEEDWPGFRSLFEQVYPNNSFPSLTEAGRTPGLGSLRNFFSNLPQNAQTNVFDEEILSLLEFMLQICPKKRPTAL